MWSIEQPECLKTYGLLVFVLHVWTTSPIYLCVMYHWCIKVPKDNLNFLYMGVHICRCIAHSTVYFMYKSRAFKSEPVNTLEKPGTEKNPQS